MLQPTVINGEERKEINRQAYNVAGFNKKKLAWLVLYITVSNKNRKHFTSQNNLGDQENYHDPRCQTVIKTRHIKYIIFLHPLAP